MYGGIAKRVKMFRKPLTKKNLYLFRAKTDQLWGRSGPIGDFIHCIEYTQETSQEFAKGRRTVVEKS